MQNARPKLPSRGRTFFSLKYSKSDRIWTVRWKRHIFKFQISDFCKWYGVWPLDSSFEASQVRTMTGQRLQMDYFNIFFQPKGFSSRYSLVQKNDASPLDLGIVWTNPDIHLVSNFHTKIPKLPTGVALNKERLAMAERPLLHLTKCYSPTSVLKPQPRYSQPCVCV